VDVEPFGAVRFTSLARLLAQEARRHGLAAPGFRFPPRLPDVDRTIRRYPAGGAVISVRVRGRSADAIAADMVEGIVVANSLTGTAADGWRVAFRSLAGIHDHAESAQETAAAA
jgi:hypothetical protein